MSTQPTLLLCADNSDASNEAKEVLDKAKISFAVWDATKLQPADWTPPFLIRGGGVYGGLEAIKAFVAKYRDLLAAEEFIRNSSKARAST